MVRTLSRCCGRQVFYPWLGNKDPTCPEEQSKQTNKQQWCSFLTINPTTESPDLHRTGETDFWRPQTKPCVHQDPGERRSESTKDWPRLAREDPRQRGVSGVACCRVGGTERSTACMWPLEEGHLYLHYLHHSLASGQITGREHSPTH